jgi:peptide/nickel transport system substrate-binding protein
VAEAVVNDLKAVGISIRMRPMERAAFYGEWKEKKLRGLIMTAVGNSGNAASRVEGFIQSKGAYAYGGYPTSTSSSSSRRTSAIPRSARRCYSKSNS